ncbi:MAG TPA: glycosyltransferase [Solirubrobacteraceae bacterium]|nr:glycosyltransferase [Solirubrobacteraceae bacterium]
MLDVLIVSLGSTGGLRAVDDELLASLTRAGARVDLARAKPPPRMRTLMLTDLAWALAARRAAREALAREQARAVVYSTTTAALLWPRPGAIRFDALAAANRPGRHGLWQRPLERRRLREATLLLPQSEGALVERACGKGGVRAPGKGGVHRKTRFEHGGVLVVPVPVEPSRRDTLPPGERDIAVITYAANPRKKGLDLLLAAWEKVRRPGEELWVAGVSEGELRAQGFVLPAQAVRVVGSLPGEQYRALLCRARVYACAARREDYGIAQLEALADGCLLVTVPSPGPYVALAPARELDPRLVGEDLGTGLRTALDYPLPDYAARALAAIAPYRRDAVDGLVARELVARLS